LDLRNQVLARNLVNYSCRLQKDEKVLIELKGTSGLELAALVVEEAYRAGALPFVRISNERTDRAFLLSVRPEQLRLLAEVDGALMENMQAYIGIRSPANISELSDVPARSLELNSVLYSSVVHSDIRIKKTKWVILRYPNESMAQLSNMSLAAFEDYYYSVCNLDYGKMSAAMDPLKELMDNTDMVRICGPGTDVAFSIKGVGSVKCDGLMNIPDGEIYTAPVRGSVNGTLRYNTASTHDGFLYNDIEFEFKDGKIVRARANDTERINKVLDTDEGARYIGEFALGVNPYIVRPMNDTLFDEKIAGSFHFTPGRCYADAPNGNQSAVHWDIVCIQTPEYGGGEIYFDGVLIRKDGMFVPRELQGLNSDKLK